MTAESPGSPSSGTTPSGSSASSGPALNSAALRTSSAQSRSGGLSVVTTAEGLPLTVSIAPAELSRGAVDLADALLRLCQQSAMAAGIALRSQLQQSGVASDIIDAMKLPTSDDLASAEQRDDEHPGASGWLR